MFIISIISIISIILQSVCYVGRFPTKNERFCGFYLPNHVKSKNRRNRVMVEVDDTKQCQFNEHYNGNTNEVLSNLRHLSGNIETHPQYCIPVNMFAPAGKRKYWVKASTPALGLVHCVCYINALVSHFTLQQVFLVLCPGQGHLSFYGQVL